MATQSMKFDEKVQHFARVSADVNKEGHYTPSGKLHRGGGKMAERGRMMIAKNAENLHRLKTRLDNGLTGLREKISTKVQDVANDFEEIISNTRVRETLERAMADGRMNARELAEVIDEVVDVATELAGDAKATALGVAHELGEEIEELAGTVAQETEKANKNISRVSNLLERMGVFSSGKMLEDMKNGAIHIGDHYINFGAVAICTIMLKSMRYVVVVDDAKEGDNAEKLSMSTFTDWLSGKGRTSFEANPVIKSLNAYAIPTQPGGAGTAIVVARKTAAEMLAIATTLATLASDENADKLFVATLANVTSAGSGTLSGFYQITASGLELSNALDFAAVVGSTWTVAGAGASSPIGSFSQTLPNIISIQEVKTTTEKLRMSGALDLASGAKVGAWMLGTKLSDWASIITPFFSNSLGNIVTDNKLFDFISTEK